MIRFKLFSQHIEDPAETEAETEADFFDISRVCFKNDGKSSSKNPFWPQLPQAVASMVSSFAVNNFAVSDLPFLNSNSEIKLVNFLSLTTTFYSDRRC